MNEQFSEKPPGQKLLQAIFDRFKPTKIDGYKNNMLFSSDSNMDLLDFLLAMNLLARIPYDKKLKLLFDLCDDDDDGCMTPEDILMMLQRLERVFAKECANIDLNSSVLDNKVADKRSELNFHFIMGMIKH